MNFIVKASVFLYNRDTIGASCIVSSAELQQRGGKMAQNTPKRKIKDSVFTNLFQDKKYLLRLYKVLHPEDNNVTEEDIKDVTIKHILVDADYNDLGFSVGGRLIILVEGQST